MSVKTIDYNIRNARVASELDHLMEVMNTNDRAEAYAAIFRYIETLERIGRGNTLDKALIDFINDYTDIEFEDSPAIRSVVVAFNVIRLSVKEFLSNIRGAKVYSFTYVRSYVSPKSIMFDKITMEVAFHGYR